MGDNSKKDELFKRVAQLVNVRLTETKLLGEGTYSYVLGVDPKRVVKVYKDKDSYRQEKIRTSDFFEAGSFREIVLNPILKHPRIFQYDEIKYDNQIGIYKIGKRMKGTVSDIITEFDKNMFFTILKDVVSALKHIHSYGMIHSDIKPANILYTKTVGGKYVFLLCDFNIMQLATCDFKDNQNYKIFATQNYSCSTDVRDVTIDIHMLGATLLNLCLNEYKDSYDLALLRSRRDDIVKKFGSTCYLVLEIMLAPQKHRGYIQHIEEIIKKGESAGVDVRTDTDFTNTETENRWYYHNMCRDEITNHFFTCDPELIDDYHNLADIYAEVRNEIASGVKNNPNAEKTTGFSFATKVLTKLIQNRYTTTERVAKFFAQTLCIFPKDDTVEDWVDSYPKKQIAPPEKEEGSKKVKKGKKGTQDKKADVVEVDHSDDYKELNEVALRICRSILHLNYHLISCEGCLRDISRILTPENFLNDDSVSEFKLDYDSDDDLFEDGNDNADICKKEISEDSDNVNESSGNESNSNESSGDEDNDKKNKQVTKAVNFKKANSETKPAKVSKQEYDKVSSPRSEKHPKITVKNKGLKQDSKRDLFVNTDTPDTSSTPEKEEKVVKPVKKPARGLPKKPVRATKKSS
ncbi:hypothetical protein YASMINEVIRUS_1319 [Yasminevirus sp. GU-2018]|uniref:Protein kinase domain-containing protein n=1 Tax=Yasminevirus sp. GU-2018 TaxID=2420051 RepID=A0A5K0U9X0_9VIRU|nr:hypothetical protein YASMINEVIRUS_1319 [Yasminevirus sp. GU-2018]